MYAEFVVIVWDLVVEEILVQAGGFVCGEQGCEGISACEVLFGEEDCHVDGLCEAVMGRSGCWRVC